jgi:hypothetical protein
METNHHFLGSSTFSEVPRRIDSSLGPRAVRPEVTEIDLRIEGDRNLQCGSPLPGPAHQIWGI